MKDLTLLLLRATVGAARQTSLWPRLRCAANPVTSRKGQNRVNK